VAVADERTNSLVVSAPEELMSLIEKLVREVDTASEDITEIWVFTLQYADATETAQLITELFPDTSSSSTQQFAPRFGRGGMMGGPPMMGNAQQSSSASSERQLQQPPSGRLPIRAPIRLS
jgi:type II secretory pathway component GspD/PulD (secretin)